ncbi:uncharacterized protein MYCGRDRAFT_106588 [Zymoseptoria tritici IPO323]|uniref:Secreted protein n=1 Tax=Zymoseptoria tritici (strain CBS 115943 / IPO323) TaxID=336722 RepID=F9XQL6_ZYMTI|nr:uncharacterized protein MYCGRDRAFT_106588 [Zymoseptoria tritici IPO323]EGP82468.1 hypothetical protein MYCGRDRAFT_106588 [Zymoseptoria tritici IPO323]
MTLIVKAGDILATPCRTRSWIAALAWFWINGFCAGQSIDLHDSPWSGCSSNVHQRQEHWRLRVLLLTGAVR